MSEHETKARELKQQGNNCSNSLFGAFRENIKLEGNAPAPRSIEGKCGALLTAIKILKDTGHEDKIEEFEKEFIKRFGYSKCADLITHERRCNDYVGESARIIDKILNQK